MINETLKNKYSKVESYSIISINNDNNFIKLISTNNEITTSKNYLLTKLDFIKAIFVKTNYDDNFIIKLISEELTNYLNEENSLNLENTIINDKKFSIDFIHSNVDTKIFYNPISNELKMYEINNISYLNLDNILNNKYNYSLLSGMKSLDRKRTHIILKKSNHQFLYEKYVDNSIISLDFNLYKSRICYLFLNFEYKFLYNIKFKKILMKVLNNNDINKKNAPLYFYCNNELSIIINNNQILNVEKCNGTFIMAGYNTLIYFYVPYTIKDSYEIIENKEIFELSQIYQFFFIPKKK